VAAHAIRNFGKLGISQVLTIAWKNMITGRCIMYSQYEESEMYRMREFSLEKKWRKKPMNPKIISHA